MGSFQKFCLRWNNHSSNFVGNLGSLLASEEYSDVTLCCQGEVWHLHQLVLSASSAHFAHLLRLIPPGQTPILILDGPPANDIEALIHFIYHGEVNVDQESLPSLLRTAASLRIKGLADVSALTGGLKGENFSISPQEPFNSIIPDEGLGSTEVTTNEAFEDVSPLNLSCHKNHEREEEEDDEEGLKGKRKKIKKIMTNSPCYEEISSREISHADSSNIKFHPSKKIRTYEPGSIPDSPTIGLISPDGSRNAYMTPQLAANGVRSLSHSAGISDNSTANRHLVATKKDVVTQPSSELVAQHHSTTDTLEATPNKEGASYINISSNVSFPLPILKMALSPNSSYQPSSTTILQPKHEISDTDHDLIISDYKVAQDAMKVSAISDVSQIPFSYSTLHPTPTQASTRLSAVCKISPTPTACIQNSGIQYSPVKLQGMCFKEELSKNGCKYEPVMENVKEKTESRQSPKYTDAATNVTEVSEMIFTHKKFSTCTIPQSTPTTKTFHIVKGVTNSPPSIVNPTNYRTGETLNAHQTPVDSNSANASPELFQKSPTPNIVKLTPVAVTTYTACKPSSTYATNSIVYSVSAESEPSDVPQISSSNLPAGEVVPTTQCTKEQSSQYLQPLFRQTGSKESLETASSVSSGTQPLTTSAVTTTADGGGGAALPNAQRVTINMRTFKEEWRRQLLVDYDPNTNMSICMLCFTTFKSYDGPRKNTYVKHARRFHPSLDDYSDEERGVIISMYEKYHKYDIDMQKEVNKSFRTTNNSGAAIKRMRTAELNIQLPIPPTSTNAGGVLLQCDTEPESSVDDKGIITSELQVLEQREPLVDESTPGGIMETEPLGKMGEVALKRTRSSEKMLSQDTEIPNNNNNNKCNMNRNDLKHSDTTVTSL